MSEGKPIRVQLSRKKGWRMPANTVKVDRTSPWGNPYRAGLHCDHQHAVDCHRYLVKVGQPTSQAPHTDDDDCSYGYWAREHIGELKGKNLACWCPLDAPCHADVLLELANTSPATLNPTPERTNDEQG